MMACIAGRRRLLAAAALRRCAFSTEPRGLASVVAADLAPAARDANGAFVHPAHWGFRLTAFRDILKWQFTSKEPGPCVPTDVAELDAALPVLTPDFAPAIPIDHARMTWLGHASVLLEVPVDANGRKMTVLTDPVFTERCSPVQWAGPKRYRPAPLQVADLPTVDAVVISHNHYDHLDETTISELHARFPNLQWYVPLDNTRFLAPLGIPVGQITEQNWWDATRVTLQETEFTFSLVPAMHWSRRYFHDTNRSLWGGWVVHGVGGSFYFSGDTAYCDVFGAIRETFGEFSVSAIPIGAYGPRHIFGLQHCDVAQAIKIHKDVSSRSSLGIHWGTWTLTGEHYLEPKLDLQRLMADSTDPDAFYTLDHGASRVVRWRLD